MPRKATCTCGVCNRCKHREYMRNWYQRKSIKERRAWIARRDIWKVRAADRARYQRDKKKRIKAMVVYNRRKRVEDPVRRQARVEVGNAIRLGRLFRGPCEVCGNARVDAHHDDYSKPLEVRWLCKIHHEAFHHRK